MKTLHISDELHSKLVEVKSGTGVSYRAFIELACNEYLKSYVATDKGIQHKTIVDISPEQWPTSPQK